MWCSIILIPVPTGIAMKIKKYFAIVLQQCHEWVDMTWSSLDLLGSSKECVPGFRSHQEALLLKTNPQMA